MLSPVRAWYYLQSFRLHFYYSTLLLLCNTFFVKNITIWLQNRGGPKAAFFYFTQAKAWLKITPAKCLSLAAARSWLFFVFLVSMHQQLHAPNLVSFYSIFASKYHNAFSLFPTSKNCCIFSSKLLIQVRYFYPATYYSCRLIFFIGFYLFSSLPFCSIICSHPRKRFCCIFAAFCYLKVLKYYT